MSANRRPRPVPRSARRELYVFVEGKTEASYLNQLKQRQRAFMVRVIVGQSPEDMVDDAIAQRRRVDRISSNLDTPQENWPLVWCLFDHDDHARLHQAIERARRANVCVGFSHPCFELWLLLHFLDFGGACHGRCARVVEQLGKHLPRYRKGIVDLSALSGRLTIARTHAIALDQRHIRDGVLLPTQRDPSTNVHELISLLGVTY